MKRRRGECAAFARFTGRAEIGFGLILLIVKKTVQPILVRLAFLARRRKARFPGVLAGVHSLPAIYLSTGFVRGGE